MSVKNIEGKMEQNSVYESPETKYEADTGNESASKAIKVCAIVLSIISLIELTPIGISHESGGFYTVGHALSGILISGFVVGIFQIFKFFRSQGPRLAIYNVMLAFYLVVYFPQLMTALSS